MNPISFVATVFLFIGEFYLPEHWSRYQKWKSLIRICSTLLILVIALSVTKNQIMTMMLFIVGTLFFILSVWEFISEHRGGR